jgi:hypothetical protein
MRIIHVGRHVSRRGKRAITVEVRLGLPLGLGLRLGGVMAFCVGVDSPDDAPFESRPGFQGKRGLGIVMWNKVLEAASSPERDTSSNAGIASWALAPMLSNKSWTRSTIQRSWSA